MIRLMAGVVVFHACLSVPPSPTYIEEAQWLSLWARFEKGERK